MKLFFLEPFLQTFQTRFFLECFLQAAFQELFLRTLFRTPFKTPFANVFFFFKKETLLYMSGGFATVRFYNQAPHSSSGSIQPQSEVRIGLNPLQPRIVGANSNPNEFNPTPTPDSKWLTLSQPATQS